MTSQKQNTVHFVCTGNTFRSRLAEGYFKSIQPKGWIASSSGTHAENDLNKPITPWAKILAEESGIMQFINKDWHQVECKTLRSATLVVFLNDSHEAWAEEHCDLSRITYKTLDVEDMVGPGLQKQFKEHPKKMRAERNEEIHRINDKIKKHVKMIVDSINNDTLLQ